MDDSSGVVTLAAGSKHKVIVTGTCTVNYPHAVALETCMLGLSLLLTVSPINAWIQTAFIAL